MCSQVALFKEAGLPLDAIPYKAPETGDSIVVRCTSTEEDMLVEEYWYGTVGLLTKTGTWIKFYGLGEDNDAFISEEKHKLKLSDYYDTWMLVQKRDM